MIAVHLTPKDISLWKRLAQLSTQQGLVRQAIYCYTQVGAAVPRVFSALFWPGVIGPRLRPHRAALCIDCAAVSHIESAMRRALDAIYFHTLWPRFNCRC